MTDWLSLWNLAVDHNEMFCILHTNCNAVAVKIVVCMYVSGHRLYGEQE